MERGNTGVLAAPPANPRSEGRVDGDIVSRFATCCRALGIVVYDRQRPADLAAARSGFTALTRVAHDQCDAWTGLAAAGDVSLRVLEAVSGTAATAGTLQRRVELAPGALGFHYDTGLYLKFRATDPDDFHLAYAAALATEGRFADADRIVAELVERRPGWREARWVGVVINYRAERWSDVVKLLTPIVNDSDLDDTFSHAAKIALGTALARLGMFAPALSYLEEPDGPVAVAAVDGALAKALVLRAHVDEDSASEVLQDLYAAHPENEQIEHALSDTSFGIVTTTADRIAARTDPWDPQTEPAPGDFGETEAKTNAIIDSALDGVLFLDEAYALVATGAKNDFGLVAIDTLLARMENDRDRLVVIIAGYRADLDKFLDTNQGLRSRFTRSIDFPSYKPAELIEIANFMAGKRDSVFDQAALKDLEALFAHLASTSKPDFNGVERRGLDIAGNGRFVRNVVEKSEEEREFRLDHSESAQTGDFTDEELMTITTQDVRNSVVPLLRGLGLSVPA